MARLRYQDFLDSVRLELEILQEADPARPAFQPQPEDRSTPGGRFEAMLEAHVRIVEATYVINRSAEMAARKVVEEEDKLRAGPAVVAGPRLSA